MRNEKLEYVQAFLFVSESKKQTLKEADKIIKNVSKTILTTATF